MSVKEDKEYEKWCQENIVKPLFYAKVWGKGRILSSDMMDNEVSKVLDLFASTDKVIIDADGLLYTLGQRIQRAKYAHFKSFTIRDKRYRSVNNNASYYKSELYKLMKATQRGSIHSSYMAHCYMNGDDKFDTSAILCGMVVKTDGLLNFMIAHPKQVKENETISDGYKKETFKYIPFKYIRRLSPEIIIAEYTDGSIITPKLQHSNQKTIFAF